MPSKFLFATMPFDGHFNPLTGIAKHLSTAGHDVRWYCGPSYAEKLRALDMPHYPFVRAQEVNGENIADVHPERAKLRNGPKLIAFDMTNVFVAHCGNHFDDIAEVSREFPFDALFCDSGFYAAKLVADLLDVPVWSVGPDSLTFTSRDAPPPFFGLRPARTPAGRLRHRIVRAMIASTMRDGLIRFNALLAAHDLAPLARPLDFLDLPAEVATVFLQVGVPGFEFPRSDAPDNLRYVGPLLPHRAATGASFAHADRVREHPSVVVVSQGTVDNKDFGKLIVPALEALSGSEHLVLVTTGGTDPAPLRRRFDAGNVVIEPFLDFDAVFEHARVFVCNGGFGSVLMALSKGVPVVSAGTREGKNDTNARIAHSGVGVDLRTERPRARRIAAAVARVAADPSYAARAAHLRDELAGYDPFELIDRYLALHSPATATAMNEG